MPYCHHRGKLISNAGFSLHFLRLLQRMAIIQLLQVLLLMAFVMTNFPESKSLPQAAKQKTTCGIRRLDAFDMMLTCYFHDNISALQIEFTVYLYKQKQQSPKTVVSCSWTPEFFCYVASGYKYEDDIVVHHDHTNIRILHANTEHVGTYSCQVMGESDSGNCSLTEEKPPPTLSSPVPYTELTLRTNNVQTTTPTSVVSSDQQTQSSDEQSSAVSEPIAAKEAREEKEHKDTETQGNTVIHVVPSVVLSAVLIGIIIAVIVVLCRRRIQKTRTVRKENDTRETESIKLMGERQPDECHNESPPPIPGDHEDCPTTGSHLTDGGEDKQQTREESAHQQGPEVKTRSEEDDDSCLETANKCLVDEPSDLVEKTGIQERGDDDIQDDERNVDGGLLELQQTHSHIDAPKKFNKEEEEDSPVTETALTTGRVKVREVQ
ncbi:uncharacterized protein LOC112567698 isoform X3 [Pomacea canaliculata]|uniref:uncharacterized protein LOC112567698 isoform X3 n=1 Tax=Pomacea canaliculata TaxID=400727 RepID=UPI000D731B95|nr:uncharacterized protein LOC112567698 isoform X3 [Pomacea canaliculata]